MESVQPHPALPGCTAACPAARDRDPGRRLPVGHQALLVRAHLRCGNAYMRLAAWFGIGIGIATVYRYVREVVDVPATDPACRTARGDAARRTPRPRARRRGRSGGRG
ncbi:transposase family protein [Streptomyces sp. NPDC093089]|uniref:transposase family protein n=1 Tax=Streptomyces sp. NPDC093089 TaxID=3366024 RepID=UPI003828D84D